MGDFTVNASRWLLLAVLVYAPWAYGCTVPWTIDVLNVLLGTILVLWGAGSAARRVWPVIPSVPLWASLLLILQAWWMVGNAKSEYDGASFTFIELSPLLKWAPGTLHKSISFSAAVRVTLLLGVGCFCCDLARRPVWQKRLVWTLALSGISIVVLGLMERLAGAPGIFWGPADDGQSFFGTYRYHANAGAFINLIWPLTAGVALLAFKKSENPRPRILWSAGLVICLAGVFVNASRAANLIAVALLAAGVGWFLLQMKSAPARWPIHPAFLVVVTMLAISLLAGMAAFGGLETTFRRWAKFSQELSLRNPRLLVAEVCLRMLPTAGLFGFGPGTFQTAFPYYTKELGDEIAGVWLYAHDDYLQTLVEWGWLGASFWAIYVFGAITFSWRIVLRYRQQISSSNLIGWFAITSALVGVLFHAGMDFPLQIASIQLYVVVLLGILWNCRAWIDKSNLLTRLEHRMETAAACPVEAGRRARRERAGALPLN